jgi:hypothetical protein
MTFAAQRFPILFVERYTKRMLWILNFGKQNLIGKADGRKI